jgi:hypothetical protein
VPDDGEDETQRTGIDKKEAAEEAVMEEVVPEREHGRGHDAAEQDVEEVSFLTLHTEQFEYTEFCHHKKPDGRDEGDGLEVEIERKVCRNDEADSEEVAYGVRADEEHGVGDEPDDKKDEAAHGGMIP